MIYVHIYFLPTSKTSSYFPLLQVVADVGLSMFLLHLLIWEYLSFLCETSIPVEELDHYHYSALPSSSSTLS